MRSLPQPRYSRSRTIQRIWRSMINLFSTGYISDSSAFAHHSVIDKSTHRTKIRMSRVTRRPTPRATVLNKLGTKLVSELMDDENIVRNVVHGELSNFNDPTIVHDVTFTKRKMRFWKRGQKERIMG